MTFDSKRWLIIVLMLAFNSCFISLNSVAQVPDPNIRDLPAALAPDPETIEVVIPTVDGMIVWKDVAASLAETLHLDAPTLEKMFPTGNLDLRSPTTLLVLFSIDLAFGDSMTIKMTKDAQGQPALRIGCDAKSLGLLAPQQKPSEPVSIQIDDNWRQRTVDKPLVVCFHGLKSAPEKFDSFRQFVREAGIASAAISYDDHQSIVDSAAQINQLASQLFAGGQTPQLVLVGHSMGGLVAREWIENPNLNAENIAALITVATPHRGSNWASLPPLLDFFVDGNVDSQDLVDVILHKPSAPGLRELAPESKFLTELASRKRRPGTKYTTIVGTGSPVSADEVRQLRETLQRLDQEGSMLRLIRPRIQPLLQSFDELVEGKGDGVVAVDRAVIDGVEDVVTVDVTHIDMFSPTTNRAQPVWNAILNRLKK